MTKTDMLYMQDNYIKSFSAKVLIAGESYVVLDKSAFYPLGGGQESDTGTMTYQESQYLITKVLKENNEIRHYFESSSFPPPKDSIVQCELDWEKRFTHMRYHSAIHILSRFMHQEHHADVVGNNISTRHGRVDFNIQKALTDEQLRFIEEEVNTLIASNMPIKIEFMPREEAITFLKKHAYQTDYIEMVPPSVKIFRVISVGDYDFASCAGTHVANTSEIGKIRILKRRSMGIEKERITLELV